jgi:hypothetical protein
LQHQQLISVHVDLDVVGGKICGGDKVIDGDAGTTLGEPFAQIVTLPIDVPVERRFGAAPPVFPDVKLGDLGFGMDRIRIGDDPAPQPVIGDVEIEQGEIEASGSMDLTL